MVPDILTFDEAYFERIWGGRKLETVCGKPIPAGKPIGEAWLVSDHREHVSTVAGGPLEGRSLRDLLAGGGAAVLGSRPRLTVHGQFPLLLKMLDAADYLSVQVHPDDKDAARLGEPDVGKTEMWHVLQAEPGSELICGMPPEITRDDFAAALREKRLGDILTRFPVNDGASVFVPAGTVHAIGPGILLAEIQQNSNITYRVYDWDRLQADGKPRELHVDKSLEVTHFGSRHAGPNRPLMINDAQGRRTILAACRYFAAELLEPAGTFDRTTDGATFHILLGKTGQLALSTAGQSLTLTPGQAAMVAGHVPAYSVAGEGACLDYYVPDLKQDIAAPLLDAGYAREDIVALGGDSRTSDLAKCV